MLFFSSSYMSKKGFTLFTALVSFILLGITVMVIQHVSNSEDNYTQILLALQTQDEINSLKDTLRQDGFHTFNLLLRKQIHAYFNVNLNIENLDAESIEALSEQQDIPWAKASILDSTAEIEDLIEEFEVDRFFGKCDPKEKECGANPFASYLSQSMLSLLQNYSGSYKSKYSFKMFDPMAASRNVFDVQNPENIRMEGIYSGTKEGFEVTRKSEKDKFINYINCNNQSCDNGSFYINIDFHKIEPQNYLNMPRILVYRQSDYSAIDDVILPRAKLSLYVPMRIFGAMFLSKNKVLDLDFEEYKTEELGYIGENCPESLPLDFSSRRDEILQEDFKSREDITAEMQQEINNSNQTLEDESENGFKAGIVTSRNNYTIEKSFNLIGSAQTGQSLGDNLVKEKLQSVDVYIIVSDKNPIYSFGYGSTEYLFKFNIFLNDKIENPPQIECNYSITSGEEGLIWKLRQN
jgi:hypothetical protein